MGRWPGTGTTWPRSSLRSTTSGGLSRWRLCLFHHYYFCHHCYLSHLYNRPNHHGGCRIEQIQIVLVVIAFPIAIVFVISIVIINRWPSGWRTRRRGARTTSPSCSRGSRGTRRRPGSTTTRWTLFFKRNKNIPFFLWQSQDWKLPLF